MQAQGELENILEGMSGYVRLDRIAHGGRKGALLHYLNPDPRKLHAIDSTGMQELEQAIAILESFEFNFCIFRGNYDPLHAGADITEFAGDPSIDAIRVHLHRGTRLDERVKQLWPRMRTVSIIAGERFGGSVEWPLFAEYAVAAAPSRIQLSEVTLGIVPGWNGVLNVLLKSGPLNARYMGATGNPVKASQMLELGLAQRVVETPAPPDKGSMTPDDYVAAWASHAEACQALLLDAALELATTAEIPQRMEATPLCTEEELAAELERRTTPGPYAALQAEIAERAEMLDPTVQRDEVKALMREAAERLAQLGKPLAPAAVEAVQRFVDRWQLLPREEILARYGEAGLEEADACVMLMSTEHRRRGVNAVLSKEPAERVPVFD